MVGAVLGSAGCKIRGALLTTTKKRESGSMRNKERGGNGARAKESGGLCSSAVGRMALLFILGFLFFF